MSRISPIYNPTATSTVAQTVQQHAAPASNILWGGWFCPFTQRSWIVLEEKGIPYQYREINPCLKEPSFLWLSPEGFIPGLEVEGKPLHDSTVIGEFLNEFSPGGVNLLPVEPYDRAISRLAIGHINRAVVPAFFRLLQAKQSELSKQAAALVEFKDVLAEISKKGKGPYFIGEAFSLVDIAIAPWAVRDFIIRDFRGFVRDEVIGWKNWAGALEHRQSVVQTTSSPDKYVEFNGTFLRNELHSLAGLAASMGQAIP